MNIQIKSPLSHWIFKHFPRDLDHYAHTYRTKIFLFQPLNWVHALGSSYYIHLAMVMPKFHASVNLGLFVIYWWMTETVVLHR